ncbi:MAG: hypothetical protein IPI60_20215 [Saprospiraceae bacterium]|nr:hypothetical protein [Saprospiraceae bacterium]
MKKSNDFDNNFQQEDNPIDLRKLFWKMLRYWYLFILFPAITLTGAYLYLRYTPPTYQAKLKLLIKDEKSSGQVSEANVLKEMGFTASSRNIENEVLILQSSKLMEEVVKDLNLQYRYWQKGRIRNSDLYQLSPVEVVSWVPDSTFKGTVTLQIEELDNNNFNLSIGDTLRKGEFGKVLVIPGGKVTLSQTFEGQALNGKENPLFIDIKDPLQLARQLAGRVQAAKIGKNSTMLDITLEDGVPQRASDILRELIDVYNEKEIEDKNRIYENTLRFIDERLNLLTDELQTVESEVRNIMTRSGLIDMSTQGSLLLTELSQYNREYIDIEVQREILESIETFLKANPNSFEFVPTNMTLDNLTLSALLGRFNELLIERERIQSTLGPNHPNIAILEKQLSNLRSNILENVAALKKDIQVGRQGGQ